jgi:hypothetical protein
MRVSPTIADSDLVAANRLGAKVTFGTAGPSLSVSMSLAQMRPFAVSDAIERPAERQTP